MRSPTLVLLLGLTSYGAAGGETVALSIEPSVQRLGTAIDVLHDESGTIAAGEALGATFLPNPGARIALRDTRGTYWLRFSLRNDAGPAPRILALNHPHVDRFALYTLSDGAPRLLAHRQRIASRLPAVQFTVPAAVTTGYLLQIDLAHHPLDQSVDLYPPAAFYRAQLGSTIFYSLFGGFVLALLLYNLSLYVALRMSRHLVYCAFLSLQLLIVLGVEGFLYLLPAPLPAGVVEFTIPVAIALAGFLTLALLRDLLELDRLMPRLDRRAKHLQYAFALATGLIAVGLQSLLPLVEAVLLLVVAGGAALALQLSARGRRAARFFAAALIAVLVGVGFEATRAFLFDASSTSGAVSWMENYLFYTCSLLEMFFMSLALAAFIRQLRDDKDNAQRQAVASLEAQRRLEREHAGQLEQRIEQATCELRRKSEELEELNRYQSHAFTHISHEFRTPLTLIQGPVREALAGAYGGFDERGRQALEICARNVERLSQLIDELLQLAALEAGGTRLAVRPQDLNQFCRRTGALFAHTMNEKHIDFGLEIPRSATIVYFDAPKLEKVLCNLLLNAVKYTPEGGAIRLSVSGAAPRQSGTDDFVDIAVDDSGPGIPDDEHSRVFERFYRAAHTGAGTPGSGIGLALVKGLVTMHGGRVTVENRYRNARIAGSRFVVSLPLGADHLTPQEMDAGPRPPPSGDPVEYAGPGDGAGTRLLVVEDDADMRAFLQSTLGRHHDVVAVADGGEALGYLSRQTADLVVSDVMMPGMDGIDLLQAIRSQPATQALPVMLLTARAADEDRLRALRASADDYLAKPFDPEELRLRVANLVRRAQPRGGDAMTGAAPAPTAPALPEAAFLRQARESVLRNIARTDFDVQALADELHISRSTLQRRIEAGAGTTPARFMREIRLARAHEHMVSGAYRTLAEAAYAVGFSHPGYFARLYRNYTARSSD